MLPLHIADATAAIRISGRRLCSRPHLHTRAAAPSSNRHLSQQTPSLWNSTRWNPPAKDSQWLLINRFFVNALVKASLCQVHSASSSYSTSTKPRPSSTPALKRPLVRYEYQSTLKNPEEVWWYKAKVPEEYKPVLRTITGMEEGDQVLPHPPQGRPRHASRSRALFDKDDHFRYLMPMAFPEDWEGVQKIRNVRAAARQAQTSPSTITNETLFELYRRLPGHRVPFLDRKTFEILIGRLMSVPLRNQVSMLRYLTLIEDMKSAGVPVMRSEWNQAVAFVARSFKYTSSGELHAALKLWQESERDFGALADITTFNILLDGASKSRSVNLAATIMKEMRERKLQHDRFTYTTLMMYHANLGDAVLVRQTYQDLVDAGEVVDTVVLNALMRALIMVNEERSAANVYAYMKRVAVMTKKRPSKKLLHWKQKRLIAQRLKRRGLLWGKLYVDDLRVQLEPDLATFHLWIHLYCRAGDWERVQYHVRDMEMFCCPMVRDVYLSILKGFAWHGTPFHDTPWNVERLRLVLDKVLDQRSEAVGEWDRVVAVWVVRAVEKVYQNEQVLARVWDEIAAQWTRQGGIVSDFALGVYLSSMRSIAHANEQKQMESPSQPPSSPSPADTTDYLDAM